MINQKTLSAFLFYIYIYIIITNVVRLTDHVFWMIVVTNYIITGVLPHIADTHLPFGSKRKICAGVMLQKNILGSCWLISKWF